MADILVDFLFVFVLVPSLTNLTKNEKTCFDLVHGPTSFFL